MLSGTQLLPLYRTRDTTSREPNSVTGASHATQSKLHNVWDEREELFGIGDDEDDNDEQTDGVRVSKHGNS